MLFSSAKTSFGGTLKEKTHLSTFRPCCCKPTQNLPKCYFPVPKTGFGDSLFCTLKEKTDLDNFPLLGLQTNPKPAQMLFSSAQNRCWRLLKEKTHLDTLGPFACKPTPAQIFFPAPKTAPSRKRLNLDTFGPLTCKPTQNLPKCFFPVPKTGFGGALVCILKERLTCPNAIFQCQKPGFGGALVCILWTNPKTGPNVIWPWPK